MYKSQESSGGGGFGIGLLIGAAAGAGLALLFAPKAGSELREALGESMSSLRDSAAKRLRAMTGDEDDEDGMTGGEDNSQETARESTPPHPGIYGSGHSHQDPLGESGPRMAEHTKPLGGNHSMPVARSRT